MGEVAVGAAHRVEACMRVGGHLPYLVNHYVRSEQGVEGAQDAGLRVAREVDGGGEVEMGHHAGGADPGVGASRPGDCHLGKAQHRGHGLLDRLLHGVGVGLALPAVEWQPVVGQPHEIAAGVSRSRGRCIHTGPNGSWKGTRVPPQG